MEPEIARRCRSCGAAIRIRATFCPQCGKSIEAPKADTSAVVAEPQRRRSDSGTGVPVAPPPAPSLSKMEERGPDIKRSAQSEAAAAAADGKSARQEIEAGRMAEDAVLKRRRMTKARDAVEENVLPRVEKFRQVSSVVLDEAAVDPSLRFVLVACALFILFIVFLMLSLWR